MAIPGFIDLQINGFLGIDYSADTLTETDFIESCKALKTKGIVGFLPTIITTSEEVYRRNLEIFQSAVKKDADVRSMVLGFHMEGPFLSPIDGARGAHPKEYTRKPSIPLLKKLMEWSGGKLRLITMAAELEGAEELCRFAVENGITVSLGHQLASYEQIAALRQAGAKGLTHLGNANPHLVDRHKNALMAGLASNKLHAMMITDGFHIPDELIKLILLTRGTDNCFIVSDASPFAGMAAGDYSTLGLNVHLDENGKIFNKENGWLVGSSATMLECANYMASLNLVSERELENLVFYNPLKFLGLSPDTITSDFALSLEHNRYSINETVENHRG